MAENVKASKIGTARKGASRFFREVRSELKKVIWPSKKQLINNTGTVLLACLIIDIVIWLVDFVKTHIILCSTIVGVIILSIIYWFNYDRINNFIRVIFSPKSDTPDSPSDIDIPENNSKDDKKT